MKEKKIPRVMLAAMKSGSGKTVLTCTLLEALKRRQLRLKAFKCGPDFIDPMFHKKILGVSSYHLDGFFLEEKPLRELFVKNGEGADLAVLEGVMGLYDGLGGIQEKASSYQVAETLQVPIILVVDLHGMGRTLLSLLSGILSYDRAGLIKGIILNRTTEAFYHSLKPMIEAELSISVLGYYPIQKNLKLESRYLGLKLPHEKADILKQIRLAAEVLENTVDVEGILRIAAESDPVYWQEPQKMAGGASVRIGVARDEAFCFYYEENLNCLRALGAELVPFSPLYEKKLPENISGLLLGGGYPELYGAQLAANHTMKMAIRDAIASGMPSIAECGGFLYLHEALQDEKGQSHPMCGVIAGNCKNQGHLVRFGYITIEEIENAFLPKGMQIKGHEFHYYDSTANGTDCIARKPVGKREWNCIHSGANHWWGFPHLYYPSCPEYAEHFVKMAEQFQRIQRG